MLNYQDYGLLLQILKHCERIQSKISNVDFVTFNNSDDLKEIICFNLLQIGELSKNFSNEFLNSHPLAPWRLIKGMRDKVAHGYGTLDLDLIYKTANEDISCLLAYCREILSKEEIEK